MINVSWGDSSTWPLYPIYRVVLIKMGVIIKGFFWEFSFFSVRKKLNALRAAKWALCFRFKEQGQVHMHGIE